MLWSPTETPPRRLSPFLQLARRVLLSLARRFLWQEFVGMYREGYDDGRCAIHGLVDSCVLTGRCVNGEAKVCLGIEEWTALVLASTPPEPTTKEAA